MNTILTNILRRLISIKYSFIWFLSEFFVGYIPLRCLRTVCLRIMGIKLGKSCHLYLRTRYRACKSIKIGDYSVVGPEVLLDGRNGLTIGKSVVIAYRTTIFTEHHDYNSPTFDCVGKPVTIDDYAWICSNTIILPGVNIGEGAVVAAGAIVTHDVEPYSVVAGIPAKKIGERNKTELNYKPGLDYGVFV